ncbi:DUF3068 domain-containing protein [Gordonia sp. HY442]|uniref:DUF3068 domain-containing protein n=1 Tax=Gordonia zhenghanii TaxID=2911516 RepID=UPI001F2CC53A|nr:DUF3068 domain-containing protein [Gordonia zhenghanii]MCF8604476.1 DUF3068 domain-containing protein [Gordonia zhenghanii]
MKRVLLALMAFLGVACIAAAIALPTYLVPKLKVVPLDLDITSVAQTVAPNGETGDRFPARIFDRCSVSERRAAVYDAHLTQQRRSVIVDPSDENQATLQSAQTVRIDRVRDKDGKERDLSMATDGKLPCDDALLTATVDRVSVDRKTSVPNGAVSSLQLEAVPEGGNVEDASVKLEDRKGFQYKFGFDVGKRDYYYFDSNSRQDSVAKFVEERKIDGVETYHFVADVPEKDLSDLPDASGEAALGTILNMPARWWGISGKGVKSRDLVEMHRYAKATRHVYVEPTTGTIIYGYEDQHQYFKSPDQSEDAPAPVRNFQMDALNASFKWSDETVQAQADRSKHYLRLLDWGGKYVPIALGVLGVLLLVGWAILVWRGRKADGTADGNGPDGDGPGGYGPDGDGPDDYPTDPNANEPSYAYSGSTEATTAIPAVSSTDDTTVMPAQQTAQDPYWSQPPADESATSAWSQSDLGPAGHDQAGHDHVAPSPADDTDTGSFRPITDPTRPMPDYDRYQRPE